MVEEVLSTFMHLFGGGASPRLFFAPGRVNLIGEHTDYNGGHVFPCALTLGTFCAARPRVDKKLRLFSLNFQDAGLVETEITRATPLPGGSWANYVLGIVRALSEAGHMIPTGADIVFYGNIPAGAGLSSSASLEVLTGTALCSLFSLPLSPVEIARVGQRAENSFIGVSCGIMDQFASAMGKADHAIYLDTDTLDYAYAPLDLCSARILIVNSGVKHSLAGSEYNQRRSECAKALSELQKVLPVRTLGAITPDEFETYAHEIHDPVCRKRARHAVFENARTKEAFHALQAGDLSAFGRLMNASHISLRDDYEVSCPELDTLTDIAWSCPGVFGSRMTGGGFGGCTVNIVDANEIEHFTNTIQEEYSRSTGLRAEIYTASAGDGAREITQ
ncbi:MAG: galactokinase [Oscillospiraceae bacterium]|nr:galactokinase [Oscillospiraceae bacterium]